MVTVARSPKKIDLRKKFRFLYAASSKEVQVLDVPSIPFLMVDGKGDPASHEFQEAIQTLYTLSYTMKFGLKKRKRVDYPVMALEGLWWTEGLGDGFDPLSRDRWRWTLMMMQPDVVTAGVVGDAADEARKKGKSLRPFRLGRWYTPLSASPR